MRGGRQGSGAVAQGGFGELGDLLGQFTEQSAGRSDGAPGDSSRGNQGFSIDDIVRQFNRERSAGEGARPAAAGAGGGIGGLAYKAYQNYRDGQSPEASRNIAAAAADGRLDAKEQEQILSLLQEKGLDAQAEAFLANELNNPASVEELA
jgi:hypothetical protein